MSGGQGGGGQKVTVQHKCPAVRAMVPIVLNVGQRHNCRYCNQLVVGGGSGNVLGAPMPGYATNVASSPGYNPMYAPSELNPYPVGYSGNSDPTSPFSSNYVPSQSRRNGKYYDNRRRDNEVHPFEAFGTNGPTPYVPAGGYQQAPQTQQMPSSLPRVTVAPIQ